MFQFTKQQIDTFQRHANKQARKRLLESLIKEGLDASERQQSGADSERTIGVDECDRVRRVIDRWGRAHADRLDRRLEYDKEDRLVAEHNVSDGNALASFAYDAVCSIIQFILSAKHLSRRRVPRIDCILGTLPGHESSYQFRF